MVVRFDDQTLLQFILRRSSDLLREPITRVKRVDCRRDARRRDSRRRSHSRRLRGNLLFVLHFYEQIFTDDFYSPFARPVRRVVRFCQHLARLYRFLLELAVCCQSSSKLSFRFVDFRICIRFIYRVFRDSFLHRIVVVDAIHWPSVSLLQNPHRSTLFSRRSSINDKK